MIRPFMMTAALLVFLAAPGSAQPFTFTNLTPPLVPGTYSFLVASAITSDPAGNFYVYDAGNFVIRKVTPQGRVSIVAGKPGVSGHADGTASVATLSGGSGIAYSQGTLFITDNRQTVRVVSAQGAVTTIAGQVDVQGAADGAGSAASFRSPTGVAVDLSGNVYVSDSGNHTIRRIAAGTSVVSTLAGSAGMTGNADGQGASARFNNPQGLLFDGFALVVADHDNSLLRRVALDGTATVTTMPQSGGSLVRPTGIAIDASGNYFVTGNFANVYKVTPAGVVSVYTTASIQSHSFDGVVVDATGTPQVLDVHEKLPTQPPYGVTSLDLMASDGTFTERQLVDAPQLSGLAFSPGLIFATSAQSVIVYTPTGAIKASGGFLDTVRAVTTDGSGIAYVAAGCGILRMLEDGTPQMIAGTAERAGTRGCGAVDAPRGATDIWNQTARFSDPAGIARDASGVLYVADTGNSTIRMIAANGTVTTILGAAGVPGSIDANGIASRFRGPTGLALDSSGNLFIADTGNHTIRKVTTAGDVSTFAGAAGQAGTTDGTGTVARFSSPRGLAFGPDGTLFVADTGNSLIRMISPSGQVTTLTGATFNAPEGVTVDPSGAVYVADTGNEVIRVGVTGALAAPTITTSPSDQVGVISATTGGSVAFTVAATGTPSPGYQWQKSSDSGANWTNVVLQPGLYSGVATATLRVTSPSSTLNGTRFRCVVTNASGSATSASATLGVASVSVTPARISVGAVRSPSGSIDIDSGQQIVTINWNGPTVPWTLASDQNWAQVVQPSGTGSARVVIDVISSLLPSTSPVTGALTFSVPAAGYSTTIPLRYQAYTVDSAPFGVLDTPANNATGLSGSIAVSGWALDDIAVDRVEIWRDPVAGETAPGAPGGRAGKVFVGFATFVPGSRPDVEAAFPNAPFAYSAGWGYMLLTYGLPNQGNGTFTLYAFGIDRRVGGENAGLLGRATVTIDNVNSTKPFGAIDTPWQGGGVAPMEPNFGWALTPGASCSVNDVKVSIDSKTPQAVTYGDARSDIAAAFPGYTNAAAAGGHFIFDSTTMTNGLHTIGWLVTDSCGRADGVGSRFFVVANSSMAAAQSPDLKVRPTAGSGADVGRNFSSGSSGEIAADGTLVVRVAQNERVEVPLPGDVAFTPGPLPIGSTFDAATNTFMWQPAAGFLGAYDLQFTAGAHVERLRVVVGPPIRMVIDTPQTGAVHAKGFTVAGWAVDLASLDGAGIDTLHVWAYPVAGSTGSRPAGAPVFVGVARVGGARPDVARLYGPPFGGAGFTLDGTLPPGTYDLVVFAHSAATNSFEGTQTVRVVVR